MKHNLKKLRQMFRVANQNGDFSFCFKYVVDWIEELQQLKEKPADGYDDDVPTISYEGSIYIKIDEILGENKVE